MIQFQNNHSGDPGHFNDGVSRGEKLGVLSWLPESICAPEVRSNLVSQSKYPSSEHGAALIVSLLLLTVLTLLGVSVMQSTTLEEKMAGNFQDRQKAFQAGDSAGRHAWNRIGETGYQIDDFITNISNAGLYDLRQTNLVTTTGNKLAADWNAIRSLSDWPWSDTSKRYDMPDSLDQGGNQNPMNLAAAPQYVIGMHESILRLGTENYQCIPYSVIGSGQGGNTASRALVELKTIPKSSCFRVTVR